MTPKAARRLIGDEDRGFYIRAASGRKFFFGDIRPEDISISDIAHALSNVCRFTGHCRTFYSVAEHSFLASIMAPPEEALNALLHDAAEAFVTDLSTPLKWYLAEKGFGDVLKDLETRIMTAVHAKFGGSWPMSPVVKEIDHRMLATEMRDLLVSGIDVGTGPNAPKPYPEISVERPRSPEAAKEVFLARFDHLTSGR